MDNISYRSVVHYLGLKDLTPKEIHEDMVITHAPSNSMVKKWDAELKRGMDSLEDDSPSQHRRPLPIFMTSSWQTDE